MNIVSTVTQKGQVVIPHWIREELGLTRDSKLTFQLEGKKIIAQPVMTIDEAFGMIPAKGKPLSDNEMKQTIRNAVVAKFEKKHDHSS